MKVQTFFLVLLLGTFLSSANAQKTRSDIFEDNEMVFFGIDFSHARLIGSLGFTDPYAIKNSYFKRWNRLLFAEKDKYNLNQAYRKSNVDYDFTIVDKRNEAVDHEKLVIDKSYSLDKEILPSIIAEYRSDENTEGLGMVYIVESFNKTEDYAYVWVTFFDISTQKILMARRMRGRTRGFGLRNYWARTFFNIIKQTDKLWNSWKRG